MVSKESTPEIFIAYPRKSERAVTVVVAIERLLEELGRSWFRDQRILPGRFWRADIDRALQGCSVAIVVLPRDLFDDQLVAQSEVIDETIVLMHRYRMTTARDGGMSLLALIPVFVDVDDPGTAIAGRSQLARTDLGRVQWIQSDSEKLDLAGLREALPVAVPPSESPASLIAAVQTRLWLTRTSRLLAWAEKELGRPVEVGGAPVNPVELLVEGPGPIEPFLEELRTRRPDLAKRLDKLLFEGAGAGTSAVAARGGRVAFPYYAAILLAIAVAGAVVPTVLSILPPRPPPATRTCAELGGCKPSPNLGTLASRLAGGGLNCANPSTFAGSPGESISAGDGSDPLCPLEMTCFAAQARAEAYAVCVSGSDEAEACESMRRQQMDHDHTHVDPWCRPVRLSCPDQDQVAFLHNGTLLCGGRRPFPAAQMSGEPRVATCTPAHSTAAVCYELDAAERVCRNRGGRLPRSDEWCALVAGRQCGPGAAVMEGFEILPEEFVRRANQTLPPDIPVRGRSYMREIEAFRAPVNRSYTAASSRGFRCANELARLSYSLLPKET